VAYFMESKERECLTFYVAYVVMRYEYVYVCVFVFWEMSVWGYRKLDWRMGKRVGVF